MEGQSRKWMILIATTWIQAFTGTNFDFSSYSSTMKSVLGISQLQLNFLSVASDMGKAFGWCSGVSLTCLPLWAVLSLAAFMGLFGYGLQWLVIENVLSLPYLLVFPLCLMAGCSICWFNTICYVLCIRNFPTYRSLALSLSISFNGVSAALYTLIVNTISPSSETLYLFSNATVPLVVSMVALLPILRQPSLQQQLPGNANAVRHDAFIFIVLNILAVMTGLYLLFLNSLSSVASVARVLLLGAVLLLALPMFLPGVVCARDWTWSTIQMVCHLDHSRFNLADQDELEILKELVESDQNSGALDSNSYSLMYKEGCCISCCGKLVEKDRLTVLGEEHSARLLVRRWDFWLYYFAYFCGGTIGIAYSNNLGQIAQSLGYYSDLNSFITLYSLCSFFGRLLSASPDFLHDKVYCARTGWLAAALVPTPIAFFLLVASGSKAALQASTAMIGLSSGFVFAAAVSVTSELFGPNSAGVNHNILITNIPIGSLTYSLLAAIVYDSNAGSTSLIKSLLGEEMVCMGRQCYWTTFLCWGCISLVGLVSGFVLYLRTRPAYDRFERRRNQTLSS